MDEHNDLYDDINTEENLSSGDDPVQSGDDLEQSGEDPAQSVADASGDSDDISGIEDVIRDVLDDYFGIGEDDNETDTENGEKTDRDPDTEHGADEETDAEAAGGDEGYSFDPEILTEINSSLQQHSDDVSGFMANVTVSGNSVMVSLDDGSSALLEETIAGQAVIAEKIDYMSGLIILVLFVLLFDLIHRFAKRIIKNFMRGDEKNAANS